MRNSICVGKATGKVHLMVYASTFSSATSSPPICQVVREVELLTLGSRIRCSQVNMTSSASKASPSDHLAPSIRDMVSSVPSSDHSQPVARLGHGSTLLYRNRGAESKRASS